MSSCLEDLSQDVLGDAWVEASDIEGALVWLRSSTSDEASLAVWSHDHAILHRWGGDGRWDRVCVLGSVERSERWWWHMSGAMLAVIVAWRTGGGWWRRKLGAWWWWTLVRHRESGIVLQRFDDIYVFAR